MLNPPEEPSETSNRGPLGEAVLAHRQEISGPRVNAILQRPHVPALDGLRGIACLLVIPGHAQVFIGGWIGVDIFFVLSGFLVTGILIRAREAPHYFLNFYARRTLRIFPLYYAFLAATLVAGPWITGRPSGVDSVWFWTYLANWHIGLHGESVPQTLAHLWSLAIEEQFYLFWPLVVWRMPVRRLRTLCVALAVMALALRTLLAFHGTSISALYVMTPTRLDTLAVGSWLALRPPKVVTSKRWTNIVLVGGVTASVLVLWPHGGGYRGVAVATIGLTAIAVSAGALVAIAVAGRGVIASALEWTPLRVAGKYSYAAYLMHVQVSLMVQRFGGGHGLLAAIATIIITFAIAGVSWRVFEAPILSLKRFFPEPQLPGTQFA